MPIVCFEGEILLEQLYQHINLEVNPRILKFFSAY